MNYKKLAEKYKPKGCNSINLLLIAEAPPHNRETYFYKVPDNYCPQKGLIDDDTSLPATIFNHYFGRRPSNSEEYKKFLDCLQNQGIFLIDIINEPLQIRKGYEIIKENLDKLLSDANLNALNERIKNLTNENTKVIFLLARKNYLKTIKSKFPNASYVFWKSFRLDIHEANDCC